MSLKEPEQGHLHIIPLGGLGEIGKNMTVLRWGDDIIVIDAGLAFPEEEMLGIDIVIPDMTYLLENRDRVRALVLTHGHEDHVGGLPYFLRHFRVPVYGTRLTLGMAESKLEEHAMSLEGLARPVRPPAAVEAGCFRIEFFRVNHSVPDAVGVVIRTPVGTVVHSGDFKFDQTPVDGQVADFHKLAEVAQEGVLVLLSDSTNAERPGYTMSERLVGETLDEVFRSRQGRILVASFATNVHRIQQAISSAHRYGRKVAVVGRSMENVVDVATKLGYLDVPEGVLVDIDALNRLPAHQVTILTTGSQGEPMSALSRMAAGEHRRVEIVPGDTVIIAATPVPGNEKLVNRTVDCLFRLGAEVIYEPFSGVHASGHASQEEQKLMINLVRPRFFIPIHGEYRHLVKHAQLAEGLGIPRERIFVGENGTVFQFTRDSAGSAGRVTANGVLVDGLGVGDVGNVVLRDRRQLAQDGIVMVVVVLDGESGATLSGPEVISRGFVYARESEQLLEEAKEHVRMVLGKCGEKKVTGWTTIKSQIREVLSKYFHEKMKRRPMIIPIIMEVGDEDRED